MGRNTSDREEGAPVRVPHRFTPKNAAHVRPSHAAHVSVSIHPNSSPTPSTHPRLICLHIRHRRAAAGPSDAVQVKVVPNAVRIPANQVVA